MSVIFWDFDGTLVYSQSLWSNSVYKALKEIDNYSQVKFEDIKKCMAYGFTWHTPENDYSNITGEKWWDFMNKHFYDSYLKCGVSEGVARTATDKIRKIIKRTENYTIYDDTIITLSKVKEMGHVNVILSNNYPDLGEVLKNLGLIEYFDGMVVSAVEGYDKPRKELFNIAKEKFPSDSYYMVGDNVKADIGGGNNANMRTILVHKGYSELADYCFFDLYSIVDLVKNKEINV